MGTHDTEVITAHIPRPLTEEPDKLTREGMADVDAGRLIAHEAMQAWADSLDTENPLPPPAAPYRQALDC